MAKNWKIVHTGVGPYVKDQVVGQSHWDALKADTKRLVALGAIEETDADVTVDEQEDPWLRDPENTKGYPINQEAAVVTDAVAKGLSVDDAALQAAQERDAANAKAAKKAS